MSQVRAEYVTGPVEANTPDATGVHAFHYSLTQRVFLVYAQAVQPLDRRDVMEKLSIGDAGLDHAIRRLTQTNRLKAVPGRWGFYAWVPGSTLPEDSRGKDERSLANLRRGRVAVA